MKSLLIRDELLKRGVRIFTPDTFMRIFNIPSYKAKYFLETQVKESLFARLKQGLYVLRTDLPSEEEMANALYKPSYISLEYALSYYNVLPEMTYTITSITTKPTRLFIFNHKTFSYRTIKKQAFTGYFLIKKEQRAFFIADPEKALVDYLYFVSLRKNAYNERLQTNQLKKNKVREYAELFKNNQLNNLISIIFKTV